MQINVDVDILTSQVRIHKYSNKIWKKTKYLKKCKAKNNFNFISIK